MKNVHAGDKVYCLFYGHGVVDGFVRGNRIQVTFEHVTRFYLQDGTMVPTKEIGYMNQTREVTYERTLFYSKPEFDIPPEPVRKRYLNGCVIPTYQLPAGVTVPSVFYTVCLSCAHYVSAVSYTTAPQLIVDSERGLVFPHTNEGKEIASRIGFVMVHGREPTEDDDVYRNPERPF